ncbi:MAG: AraC family transcriptional regulator [Clostridia bacterium]|nr:AraC family transcriptional regulator [Clostridia bacterium]
MRDYSTSGDFGEVRTFDVCVASEEFSSLNRIASIGWHKVNDLYQIDRPRGFSAGLLLFTLSGKGKVKICDTEYSAEPGSVAIIPQDCQHTYGAARGGDWEFYWVHYYGSNSALCSDDIVRGGTYLFDLGVQNLNIILREYTDNKSEGIERELDNSEWLDHIFHTLLKKSVSMRYTSEERSVAKDIMEFLERDTALHFSLDSLVGNYHYSKEYIIRLFKNATGMTPYRYWLLLKLKRSCVALEKEDKSIEEIAREYGYQDVSSYSNQFKKYYRMSPKEYRNLYKFG